MSTALNDGTYNVSLTLSTLSDIPEEVSRVDYIASPAKMTVKSGEMTVKLEWSGAECDHLMINDNVYELTDSTVELPVNSLDFSYIVSPLREGADEHNAPRYMLSFIAGSATPIGMTPIVMTGIGMLVVVALAAIIPTVMMSVRKHREKKMQEQKK